MVLREEVSGTKAEIETEAGIETEIEEEKETEIEEEDITKL